MSPSLSSALRGPIHPDTQPAHKQVLVEKFSTDADYWRQIYEDTPDGGRTFVASEMVERKRAVLAFVDQYAGSRQLRVLDVGCGTGMTMRDLLQRGHSVTGVDITEAMLQRARVAVGQSAPGRARCMVSDIENVPLADGSFDVVLCMGVLQYLQTDEKAIAELSRLVENGGLVIVTLPNIFRISNLLDPYYYLVRAVQFAIRKNPFWKPRGAATLSPDDIETNRTFANRRYYYGQLNSLFARHHLRQLHVAGIAFGAFTFWRNPLLPLSMSMRISRFVQRLTRRNGFAVLNVFANRWVICLVKDQHSRG